MQLHFFTPFAVFLKLQFAFSLRVHIDLIPVCDVILVFADGTNQRHQFPSSLFCHGAILANCE